MPASLDNIDCESVNSAISSPPSPGSPMSPTHSLHRLDRKSSVRPYQSKDAYLYAMKEDLAVWFNDLYNTNLTADNLLDSLQDGIFLCLHANNVKSYIEAASNKTDIPNIIYRTGVKPGSFQARDNLANFINWVKNHLAVNDVLLFESDDLVLMKNQKNVVLCLLEVARRGARYGMLVPMLVQFEQEIDELEQKIKRAEGRRNSQGSINNDSSTAANSDTESDKASLDEWVQSVVQRCTCPKQFPLINVSRGKYRIGHTQNVVFVRILRNHVMIRVGGGWDTLEHYLDKHDPCRCYKSNTQSGATQRGRRRTSTAKDRTTLSRRKSPLAGNRVRSQSFTSLEISEFQPLPAKPKKSGSTDLLNSNLVIIRDDTGRHVIDESSPTKPGSPTSPQPYNPSKKHLSPSGVGEKRNQRQGSLKSKNKSLSVSSGRPLIERSSSPSQDLIKKWKDNFRSWSPNSGSRDRSTSRPRKDSTDQSSERNRSITHLSPRNRSHSRTRNSSSPDKQKVRSRSWSRPETSTSNFNALKRRVSLRASPRKDKRHSHSALPTRIPLPITSASGTDQPASNMISSTSTCNSSMDSLMTI